MDKETALNLVKQAEPEIVASYIIELHELGNKKDNEETERLLREYTQYLSQHGYIDDDWWAESPSPILEFMNRRA
jgi:hypothetical protein